MLFNNQGVKISYPCSWSYKVIGPDKDRVKDAISGIFTARDYKLRYAKASRTGKYHSWSISLWVESEAERNSLFAELKSHTDIKVVI